MTSQNVAHGQALSMAEVERVMNTALFGRLILAAIMSLYFPPSTRTSCIPLARLPALSTSQAGNRAGGGLDPQK